MMVVIDFIHQVDSQGIVSKMEDALYFQRRIMLYIGRHEKRQKLEEECGRQKTVHKEEKTLIPVTSGKF